MPRKEALDLRFLPQDIGDGQRTRRALELILGQDVSLEDATDNVEVDRYGNDKEG